MLDIMGDFVGVCEQRHSPSCGGCGLGHAPSSLKMLQEMDAVIIYDGYSSPIDNEFLRDDICALNAINCPLKDKRKGYVVNHVDSCKPLLMKRLKQVNPIVIFVAGPLALRAIIQDDWTEAVDIYSRWVGQQIPFYSLNAWVIPIHTVGQIDDFNDDMVLIERNRSFLANAPFRRPVKDFDPKDNTLLFEDSKASPEIDKMCLEEYTAFDLETTTLKAEGDKVEIYSVAISCGSRTISFLMTNENEEAFKRYLLSDSKKICHNLKFEDRYIRGVYGIHMNNPYLCTMIYSHIENNQTKVAGLKFQSFVKFGVGTYGDEAKKYFKSETSNSENLIKLCNVEQMLMYNGIDAACTYRLGMLYKKQMEKY